MSYTPQHLEYSIPPSPIIPPVPRVSPASSVSSLSSLYELDGKRLQSPFEYPEITLYQRGSAGPSPHQRYAGMSNTGRLLFTDEDLAKAFSDRNMVESPRSLPNGRLAHDISDPSSPWKRSIRLRYSDVNMRDSNGMSLQEASDLLNRDMASYVCSFFLPQI
jgi:hypothetical protein